MKQDNQKTWSHDRIRCGICAGSVDEVDRIFLQNHYTIGILAVNVTKEKRIQRDSREQPSKNKVNMDH
jgi:hypothetical protein